MMKNLKEKAKKYNWYQSIPLGDGVVTDGETGESETDKIKLMDLPVDLTGKSVLDIGCNEGFYSFEFEKRGASKIIAVDKSPKAKEKFEFVKSVFNSKVDFLSTDVLSLKKKELGRFDYVLFLAVFHHLKFPMQVLDRVFDLTENIAFLEFVEAVPLEHPELSALVRKMSKKGHLHMLPTKNFILEILEQTGFSKVEVLGTHRDHELKPARKVPGFSERRILVKAYR